MDKNENGKWGIKLVRALGLRDLHPFRKLDASRGIPCLGLALSQTAAFALRAFSSGLDASQGRT